MWAALILAAMTLVFFSPVFRYHGSFSAVYAHQRGTYPWVKPGDPPYFTLHDQADYVYPRQVFLDRSLERDRELPLWNPLTFGGHPFLAETGSRMAYPPFLLMTVLFSPVLMHDVYLMVHLFAAGMAMFALMKQLRTRFAGSLLAGVAWAFSSYALLYYVLEMYPAVAALLPLVVLFVHRWDDRRSWPSLLAASLLLGMLFLGTSAELAFMAFLFAAAYAGCLALRRLAAEWPGLNVRRAIGIVAAPGLLVGAAAAVAAVGVLPFVDLSARSGRVPVPYADVMKYFPHVDISDFARVFVPPDAPLSARGVSQQVFLGSAVGLLALVGLLCRGPGTAMARGALLVVFLFAVGGPGTWLAYQLPGINKLHGVGRAFFLFNLGLAILAGIGLDRLVRWARRRTPGAGRGHALLSVGLVTICVLATYQQLFSYGRAIHPPFQRRDPKLLLPPTPATEAARSVLNHVPGGGRVLPIIRQGVEPALGYTLPAATGMALDLPVTGGYEPVLPERVATMWRLLTGEPLASVLATDLNDTALNAQTLSGLARVDLLPRFGVSAVLAPPTMTEEPGWDRHSAAKRGLQLTYTGPDGVVYEVVHPTPRAFVVHDALWSDSADQSLARLASPDFDIRQQVLLEGKAIGTTPDVTAGPSSGSATTVRWLEDDPNDVMLSVEVAREGWLVLLDNWDPGWRATVDGQATPVLRANYGFRAVRVGAGSSTVRFSYRPTPVIVGGFISGVTTSVIVAVMAAGPPWRRRRSERGESISHDADPSTLPTVAGLRRLVGRGTGRKLLPRPRTL
ncbi:MAG: YfhO family protein [Actinobacteria bacterium]|nr:YfhO family protein [Actinomycetota bacterium]